MKEMADGLSIMMQSAMEARMGEDIEQIKNMLDNLLDLSFNQEQLITNLKIITKNDPNVHMTGFSWDSLKKAALEGKPRHRYLPNISFAVNYYFGGKNHSTITWLTLRFIC